MRKVVAMFRSRNETNVYMVIRDGSANTMSVWRLDPNDPQNFQHCYTWPFTVHPDGWDVKSDSEKYAHRRATNLASALSRMSPSEVLRQSQNVVMFGEVR